jgi:hypothetical protein
VIAQSKAAEAAGDPAQTFSSRMRIGGMRISRAYNLAQQTERWIAEIVFFQNRIERNIFAVMAELALGTSKTIPSLILVQSVFRGRNRNSAPVSTNLLMSQGQATRSTLILSRVVHFMS